MPALSAWYANTTGPENISDAHFNGEQISNGEARRMRATKTFLDVKTWIVYSGNDSLKEAAEGLVAKVG